MGSSRKIFDETQHARPGTGMIITEVMLGLILITCSYCWGYSVGSSTVRLDAIKAGVAIERNGKFQWKIER